MTHDPITVQEDANLDELVHLMEKHDVHRLPVMRDNILVGIVTRSNLLQAVASIVREVPAPTSDDDHIRDRITRTIKAKGWRPGALQVVVRNGVVHLHGMVLDEQSRQASIVAAENTAGVKDVHDHICSFNTFTGEHVKSPEDLKAAARSE
jgi:CBS domain-containing protein